VDKSVDIQSTETEQETIMLRNKTAQTHKFSVIPQQDIPRSRFAMPQTRKMAFNASELIPIMVEPILPGDVWEHKESILARLATPIAPMADDLDLETFYFAVPHRILWDGWEDFITGVSEDSTLPTFYPFKSGTPNTNEIVAGGVLDHMGLMPQNYTDTIARFNVLPIWAYFEIWNKWFRDQNLQEEWEWSDTWTDAGTNTITQDGVTWQQQPLRVNKRHDLFTSALPWPQKGAAVSMPLGSIAPVIPDPNTLNIPSLTGGGALWPGPSSSSGLSTNASANMQWSAGAAAGASTALRWGSTGMVADLNAATAASLNSLRLATVTQQLLELDARGGSRYVENLLAHWGVRSPDFRLQNPEYIGGSRIPITVNPIAQTAAYDAEPGAVNSAIGNLGAEMHASSSRGTFRYAATEHCYIIGVACIRSTPTYQQGTRAHWSLQTRYDFPDPILMNIGEQAVPTREIFQTANNTYANETWGYQEAWAQWRIIPNEITGQLRSTYAQPMDWWHLSEEFATEPALNASFITDKTQETLARALATAPNVQWSAQCIMDITHQNTVARLMPAYSVPGLRRF